LPESAGHGNAERRSDFIVTLGALVPAESGDDQPRSFLGIIRLVAEA